MIAHHHGLFAFNTLSVATEREKKRRLYSRSDFSRRAQTWKSWLVQPKVPLALGERWENKQNPQCGVRGMRAATR
jgi:hypothetical protein